MITTIKLVNISITSHNYSCVYVYVVRTFAIYCLSKFQVHITIHNSPHAAH